MKVGMTMNNQIKQKQYRRWLLILGGLQLLVNIITVIIKFNQRKVSRQIKKSIN